MPSLKSARAGLMAGTVFSREWSRRRMDAVGGFQGWLSNIKLNRWGSDAAFQSLTNAEEIPILAATSLWNHPISRRCFLICSPTVLGSFEICWFDFQYRGFGRYGREMWPRQRERKRRYDLRARWAVQGLDDGGFGGGRRRRDGFLRKNSKKIIAQ